jgi:acyl homoserine lactone synthase
MQATYLYSSDLSDRPALADAMFRDRAAQFRDRLGWAVEVDRNGWETDQYDRHDPLYVLLHEDDRHLGSMRFLPTTGPHMAAEHFAHLLDNRAVPRSDLWECTRFCLAPDAPAGAARRLMLAASELGLGLGLGASLGVFDAPMLRVYRRLGWAPEPMGLAGGIAAGIWRFDPDVHDRLLARTGVDARASRARFEAAFPYVVAHPLAPMHHAA